MAIPATAPGLVPPPLPGESILPDTSGLGLEGVEGVDELEPPEGVDGGGNVRTEGGGDGGEGVEELGGLEDGGGTRDGVPPGGGEAAGP